MVLIILLLVLFTLQACSHEPTWLRIDCGADSPYYDYNSTGLRWQSDATFISTGHNAQVPITTDILPNQMSTLRFFPDQNKNCYTLPAATNDKYQVRVAFYYGNYDGKGNPPSFDLSLDGNSWATVDTSIADLPFSHQAIVVAKGPNISVCVSRMKDGEVPFVSTIDMVHLSSDMYGAMESNIALFTVHRLNYGSEAKEAIWYPQDPYARIWAPKEEINYYDIVAPTPQNEVADLPPSEVLVTAIGAPAASDNLNLFFSLPQPKPTSYYVNLYFNEPGIILLGNRTFGIYLNGEDTNITVSTTPMQCLEYYVITNPIIRSLDLDLVPAATSDYPPFISALELFAVSQKLVNGTNEDDLKGLEQLAYNSERLSGWTGDPCLPANTAWEWLRCNEDHPPRVNALYLAGYGLQGMLQDFSQMQALEIIDLHNNSLRGPIPDFLGKLPNLKELNLAYNEFTGGLPDSLANNKKLAINATGYSEVGHSSKSHTALIVGLSTGGASLFVVICVLLAFTLYRRKRKIQQAEETKVEHGIVVEGEELQVGTAAKENETTDQPAAPDESEHMAMTDLQRQMELELGNLILEHVQGDNGNVL